MASRVDILSLLDRIAGIAGSLKTKLVYLLGAGTVATFYLAWQLYSAESALWWNILKCSLVILPTLVWAFIWSVLAQLQDAPSLVAKLVEDDQGVFSNIESLSLREPSGLTGVFSTLRAFRRDDGFSVVFETIGGVGLLANPLFAFIAFATLALLFLLILVALLVLIF